MRSYHTCASDTMSLTKQDPPFSSPCKKSIKKSCLVLICGILSMGFFQIRYRTVTSSSSSQHLMITFPPCNSINASRNRRIGLFMEKSSPGDLLFSQSLSRLKECYPMVIRDTVDENISTSRKNKKTSIQTRPLR